VTRRVQTSLFIAFALFVVCAPAQAAPSAPLLDRFSGYVKSLTTFSRTRDTKEDYFAALERLRIAWNPKFNDNWEADLTYDHELLVNDFSNTSDFSLIRQKNLKNFASWDTDRVITDTAHVYERHLLHRANVTYKTASMRLVAGKQLIDWGRMRSFSPLDLFNPPLPTDIETDERMGFDALNAEFSINDFSGVQVLYGPGKRETKTSWGVKYFHKAGTFDLFIIGAKREKDKTAGVGFDGYVGGAGVRGEFTFTKRGSLNFPRAALGADYNFAKKFYVAAEYFYNGAAAGDVAKFSDSLIEARERLSLKKNLVSLITSKELTPLLKAKGAWIYDIDGQGLFFAPELRYNVHENLDIAVGAQLFVQDSGSEFEDYQNLYYIELKYFF
jgi:hypothetical protein